MKKLLWPGLAVAILVVVAWVYLPVIHGRFVWDDWSSFRDLQGPNWLHYVFRDFNEWTFYFRPLGVALLALQIKAFDSDPGLMHAVSLLLHLTNTLLVGLLSRRCAKLLGVNEARLPWAGATSMLVYGLHPALIEPVSWIGCQFDLFTTMFTLGGLLATSTIASQRVRAAALTALFFLAACTKEAAAAFPLLVVAFDWLLLAKLSDAGFKATLVALLRRNGLAYAGMFLAGLTYIALRHATLGQIDYPRATALTTPFAHLQEVCYIYLAYWKIMIWPMAGMGPIHVIDVAGFQHASLGSLTIDLIALSVIIGGIYLSVRRHSVLGFIVVLATAAMLPALHIIPVAFERSIYHERYAMNAIALACVLLPALKWPSNRIAVSSAFRLLSPAVLVLWLACGVIGIRIIQPKWSNDISLWQWALDLNPLSTQAKDGLLLAYIQAGNDALTFKFGDKLISDASPCTSCALRFAKFALDRGDTDRAALALRRASDTPLVQANHVGRQFYNRELGRLLIKQGRFQEAEKVLEAAVAMKPDDAIAKNELIKARSLLEQQK